MLTSQATCGFSSATAESSAARWKMVSIERRETASRSWEPRVQSMNSNGPSPRTSRGGTRMSEATTLPSP